MKTLFAIFLALALSACAGNTPWENPQQYAGITHVDARWKPDVNELERIEVWSGKEGQSFDVVVDLKAGTVEWRGKQVSTGTAFASRAEVEKYVAEKFASAAPDIRNGLVDIIGRLAGVP